MVVKADLVNEFGESMYDSSKWYVRKLLTKASKGKREGKDDDDDDDDDGEEETKPISTDDFRRVGHVHRQLAHIMVTCCYKIGSKSTREYVLPILGQYFDCWSDAFGVAVEGSTEAALALSLFEGITRPLGDLLGNGIVQQLSNTTRVLWQRLARADVGSDSSNSKCWRWWWNKEVERKILEEEADKPKNKKRHGSAENEDDDEDESPLTWLEDEIDCIDPTVRSIFSQHTTDCTDDEKQRWTGPSRRFGIQAKRVATLASEAMHMRKPIAQSPRARTMIDQIVHKRPQNDTTVHLLLRGDFETCAERGRKRALAATQAALKSINHLGDETDEKVAEKSSSSSDDMDPPLLHRDETSILAHSEAVTALASRDSLLVSGGANGAVKIWQVRERLDKVVLETASLLPMRHSRPISSIHLVKSGLLTVCDGSIHIWDAERRTKLEEVRMPSRRSRFVSTTSNGQSLAAATSSGTICVRFFLCVLVFCVVCVTTISSRLPYVHDFQLTHSLIHYPTPLIHSLTQLTHSLTDPLSHSLTHYPTHSLTLIHYTTHSLIPPPPHTHAHQHRYSIFASRIVIVNGTRTLERVSWQSTRALILPQRVRYLRSHLHVMVRDGSQLVRETVIFLNSI
jgi:hypothetical protein